MLINIVLLFFAIFISMVFRYFIVKMEFFKENIMERYKSLLPESVLLDANISKQVAFDAVSEQPIIDSIKDYKTNKIPKINNKMQEIQSQIQNNNYQLEILNKSSTDYQNKYSTIIADTNTKKAKLELLNQDEQKIIKTQQDNSKIGIGIYSKAQMDYQREVDLATKVPSAPIIQSITTKNNTITFVFIASPDNGGHPVDFYTARMRTSNNGSYYYPYVVLLQTAGTYTFTSTDVYGYDNNNLWNKIPVEKGKNYYFDIVPHNKVGYGTPSNIVTFMMDKEYKGDINKCARSYYYTGDNSDEVRCPDFKPYCAGHIPGQQFGKCYAADDPTEHICAHDFNSNDGGYAICPSFKPYCAGHIGGKQWGKCVTTKENTSALNQCKGSYGQSIIGPDRTCPSFQPACVGFIEGSQWGKCATTNENIKGLNQCKGSYGQKIAGPDNTCPSFQPFCGGFVEGRSWGQCYSQSNAKYFAVQSSALNQCARSYDDPPDQFTVDDPNSIRCPAFKPYCSGHISNQQWGKCYAPDDNNIQHMCAYDYAYTGKYQDVGCPTFKPKCVGHIGGKQWGKCSS